jgi:hypothetical protein
MQKKPPHAAEAFFCVKMKKITVYDIFHTLAALRRETPQARWSLG